MRFTVSPEVGCTASDVNDYMIRISGLFSFQPQVRFGLGAMIGLDFRIPGGSLDNITIGPYVIYGNEMDGFAIGGGIAYDTNYLLELSTILLYNGFSFKIYGSNFPFSGYAIIGISVGYSLL